MIGAAVGCRCRQVRLRERREAGGEGPGRWGSGWELGAVSEGWAGWVGSVGAEALVGSGRGAALGKEAAQRPQCQRRESEAGKAGAGKRLEVRMGGGNRDREPSEESAEEGSATEEMGA